MTKEHIDTVGSTVSIDGTVINGIYPDSLPFPKPKNATKDVTTLKDTVQRKGLKILDPGSCSFSGIIIPGDAGQIALWNASSDRAEHTILIDIPDAGETFTYNAFVAADYPQSSDETYEFTCDLEVTGEATRATDFAAITSIEGAGAGITYSPAVVNSAFPAIPANATLVQIENANTAIFKEATGITTDTITVTAASASFIGISYDGGTNWTTLTSASAHTVPTANWPAAGTITKALIKVEQALKATRFVNLFISRA